MAEAASQRDRRTRWVGGLVGALLAVVIGVVCLQRVGDGLGRSSYDIPHILSPKTVPEELVMVYLDGSVKRNLGQPADQPLDRHFYTLLLDRLTRDGAKLVLFDILFDEPHPDPAVDMQFAEAIRKQGHVVLVGGYEQVVQANYQMDMPVPPTAVLTSVAAWGSARCPLDPDYGIRHLVVGTRDDPSVGWIAAGSLGALATHQPPARLADKWLNYYCPPGRLRAVNLDQVLATNGLADGYFHDKIVVVGARPAAGIAGDKRELFRSPFSFIGWVDATGPAVQAFNLLNLVRGDWLARLSPVREKLLVIVWGMCLGIFLMALRPWSATFAAIGCFAAIGLSAAFCQLRFQLWFCWLIPAAVQPAIALVWAVGYRYVVADRHRKQLRQAFSSYLSPYMADQIANSEFDLKLGGREVMATVMFTDLEGFTKMSETLPPAEVSRILTTYFNQTTRDILKQDGTIIKYIGDAVMAVWGAPMADPKHAERAVLAAWGMSQACRQEVAGRLLRTRIGVNTGMVLAGNLGSDFRFDYTLIGDTTNFASRLEGLNKYLGTEVLISESTRAQAGGGIKLRFVGNFRVAGKQQPVGIHEVLGLAADFPQDPAWLTTFNHALECFVKRELEAAEELMRGTIAARGGKDGPSEFYLAEIIKARVAPADAAWDGTMRFDAK